MLPRSIEVRGGKFGSNAVLYGGYTLKGQTFFSHFVHFKLEIERVYVQLRK
jgi:hypothetical protein